MPSSAMHACGIILVLCLVGCSVAQEEFKDPGHPTDEEMAREIGQFLQTVQSFLDPHKNMTELVGANGCCRCEDTHCRCCDRFLWKEFCIVLDHQRHSDSLELSLRCGDKKIISHTFSVKKHQPYCFQTPYIAVASACIHLNDLRISGGRVQACIAIKTRILFFPRTFDFGCFNVIQSNEKIELVKVMKLTHEMAKQVEQPAVWIEEGKPIVAFPDVFKLFMAASKVDQPLQDPDQK